MANNRMYLRCKNCGEVLLLGKTMSNGYSVYSDTICDDLNEFYDEHNFCDKDKNIKELEYCDTPLGKYKHNDNIFEIAYEIENDDLYQDNMDVYIKYFDKNKVVILNNVNGIEFLDDIVKIIYTEDEQVNKIYIPIDTVEYINTRRKNGI